jgi:hypothetical protein
MRKCLYTQVIIWFEVHGIYVNVSIVDEWVIVKQSSLKVEGRFISEEHFYIYLGPLELLLVSIFKYIVIFKLHNNSLQFLPNG